MSRLGSKDIKRQIDKKLTFYIYHMMLEKTIWIHFRIEPHIVDLYKEIVWLKAVLHHIFLQARRDKDKQWLSLHYRLNKEEVGEIIQDWIEEWKQLVIEEDISPYVM